MVACKREPPRDTTGVKSLDNLAKDDGTPLKINHCGPDVIPAKLNTDAYKSRIIGKQGQQQALKTLGAAPDNLLLAFFGQGGRIELMADLRGVCQAGDMIDVQAIGAPSSAAPDSCWIKKPNDPPVIYVVHDDAKIRHNLLRSLAYIYSGPVADALRKSYPAQVEQFEGNTNRLAEAFLEAMKTKKPDVYNRMNAAAIKSRKTFDRLVFAETIDSVYCNRETYDAVAGQQSMFRPVFNEFNGIGTGAQGANRFQQSLGFEFGQPWHIAR
jgi:hypothetical protein